MLSEISCAQFDSWYYRYMQKPWGYDIANWRNGILCATIANCALNPKEPFSPQDFYPQTQAQSETYKSAEDQLALWKAMA